MCFGNAQNVDMSGMLRFIIALMERDVHVVQIG